MGSLANFALNGESFQKKSSVAFAEAKDSPFLKSEQVVEKKDSPIIASSPQMRPKMEGEESNPMKGDTTPFFETWTPPS